ncbi:WD repeat-containing protein 36 [Artemisia annua]|uniref:WD repeat-containing protein 36 n=1 Tax=Artemisia annua TaxID=35608 RepID=A0A2U1KBT1_ARTAN|nr:WD repeat-containing protein 36 [Artemisia annua]
MSTSADNSIKMWIFDTTDADPRLLRFRSGHSVPPLCIRFYANGRHILYAGRSRSCISPLLCYPGYLDIWF